MAIDERGILRSPIEFFEISKVLGEGTDDIGSLCTSDKINSFAWAKPVSDPSVVSVEATPMNYMKHTSLKSYTVGDPIPQDAFVVYNKPNVNAGEWARSLDFVGYSHDEHPTVCDISALEEKTIDIENPNYLFPITDNHVTEHDLMRYLVNAEESIAAGVVKSDDWEVGMLIILHLGGRLDRYFIYHRGNNYTATSMVFPVLVSDMELRQSLSDIDIESYPCTAMVVAWPRYGSNINTLLGGKPIVEIPQDDNMYNYRFMLFPQSKTHNPIARGIHLTEPAKATRIEILFIDNSDRYSDAPVGETVPVTITTSRDGEYIDAVYPSITLNANEMREFYDGYEGTQVYGQRGWIVFAETFLLYENYTIQARISPTAPSSTLGLNLSGNMDSEDFDGYRADCVWNETSLNAHPNERIIWWIGASYIISDGREDQMAMSLRNTSEEGSSIGEGEETAIDSPELIKSENLSDTNLVNN